MTYAGAGMAAYGGAMGVLSSFTESGAGGFLKGTMSGAAMGAAIGSVVPVIGTVIGGVVGAAAGAVTNVVGQAMDEGQKMSARKYYEQTIFPQLDQLAKNPGAADYLTETSEANKASGDGYNYLHSHYGQQAADWINSNYMQKELAIVLGLIQRAGEGNLSYGQMQAAEFHGGGLISNFGDLGTSSNEGYIHALLGEGVVNQPAMAMHGAGVGMMNNGASPLQMAAHYLSVSGGGGGTIGGGASGGNHLHVHTIDSSSFEDFLNKRGGATAINRSMNKRASLYGGDSVD